VGEGRVGEHAVGHEPASGGSIASGEARMIRKSSVDTCVNCGFPAHSLIAQTSGGTRLQALIHPNVAAAIQFDAGSAVFGVAQVLGKM
jgi:hypothetical protein